LRLIATQVFVKIGGVKCRVLPPEMHMPNRTAKFVSAILASLLAGAPLATMSHSAAGAADDCLSAPKDATPGGGHWYYRVDRATKRHCWYLREEGEKLSQTAAPNSSPSARPAAPKAEIATQRSIADARAELPAQTRVEPPARNDAPNPAIPANAAGMESNPSANAGDADAQSSVVASRWPDPSAVSSAVSHPAADALPPRTGFARDLDRADDPGERIAEFFSQLSRRAPT
jgi:hypothetical protein